MHGREFIVVSGIPGSGKTTLGRALAEVLQVPAVDKDDFLDELLIGAGDQAAESRHTLSRRSDVLFRDAALLASRAVLVSFWYVPGMPADSGTPTDWLGRLGHQLIQVHCDCEPSVAAERFLRRQRHIGHGDHRRSRPELQREFERLASFGRPLIAPSIIVDTASTVDLPALVARLRALHPTA